MMRSVVLVMAAATLVGTACIKDDPTLPAPPPTASSDPAEIDGAEPPAPPIGDAAAFRDALLAIAQANAATDPGDDGSFGVVQAWTQAYPDLSFTGHAVPPDQGSVPVAVSLADPKDVASADNPYLIAFAVLGADGVCAGGLGAGYPAPTFGPVDFAGEEQVCDPYTVAAIGGYPIG